jgi:hypothetical protein
VIGVVGGCVAKVIAAAVQERLDVVQRCCELSRVGELEQLRKHVAASA